MTNYELINNRISVRNYDRREISASILEEISNYCASLNRGPFNNRVRMELLDLGRLDRQELKPLGTYGFIKGARYYILAAVRETEKALEDLGYCLENAIIKATSLGLGTCWLGGTFKRAAFASAMQLAEDEMLPAITPIGYPFREDSTRGALIRFGAQSHKRKPWKELFFSGGVERPLAESEAGPFRNALEAVRLGPSASNRQPWRLIRDQSGAFHFFLKENVFYNRILGKYKMQHIDMGIAMSHFEMVAREENLPGDWSRDRPAQSPSGMHYVATWL